MLTIYCAKSVPLTEDELRSVALDASAITLDSSGVAQLEWPGCRLELSTMAADKVAEQVRGLVGFLSIHGTTDELVDRARAVVAVLRITLADEPDDLSVIWPLIEGLASARDGFVFAPDGLFEVDGTPLLPFYLALEDGEGMDGDDDDLDDDWDGDDDWDSDPPTPLRVARRALALAAVVMRAHLESDDRFSDPEAQRQLILAWLSHHNLMEELEDRERELLEAPLTAISQREVIEASWRAEGLVVLAWALGKATIPQHDTLCDPAAVANELGFLSDDRPDILDRPRLVDPDRLQWLQDRLLGIHWRLRDYRLSPRPMNYREFSQDCWFGSFDIDGVTLARDDLAIDGQPIHLAPDNAVARAESIALERHQAINWLLGWDPLYSDVDTST